MESHKRKSVGGSLEYMCDRGDCKKTFRRIGELRVHLNLHDNIVKKCFFCPWVKADGKLNLFNQHLDHHFITPRYKCTKCDAAFYQKNNLDFHFEITHEIIKDKYKCKNCKFQTYSKNIFFQHLRSHRNQKLE